MQNAYERGHFVWVGDELVEIISVDELDLETPYRVRSFPSGREHLVGSGDLAPSEDDDG